MKRTVGLIILLLLLLYTQSVVKEKFVKHNERPMLLLDSMYYQILKYELEHPKIVFSQLLLESDYATSDLYINNHNLFGMKESGNRATTSNVIVNGYKYYDNWKESILDYALFQMAFYRKLTEEEYIIKLKTNYAKDSLYDLKIKRLVKNLKY